MQRFKVMVAMLAVGATMSGADRVPVLLELFTSEGCSSCPPADKLLGMFDREQPVNGADLIVLSEHVDYWNRLGWTDPFSSPAFSKRQRDYAGRLGADGVYTPQLVVDGSIGLVGSDQRKAVQAIQRSLRESRVPIALSALRDGEYADVHFDVPQAHGSTAYLVAAEDHARSQVAGGENAGRTIDHVAVAYSITKIAEGSGSLRVKLKPGAARLIAFVQNGDSGHVSGAAQVKLEGGGRGQIQSVK